jgi:hypothetical protein
MAQARYNLTPGRYSPDGLRIITPINTRPFTRPTDRPSSRIRVYITASITTSHSLGPSSNTRLWQEAQTLYKEITYKRTKSSVIRLTAVAERQIRLNASPGTVTRFIRTVINYKYILSNLSKLDLDKAYGNFRIVRV